MILVDLWAEWCEACKDMDIQTFSNPKIIEHINTNNWLVVKVDMTKIDENTQAILDEYKVQGLPTLIIIDPEDKDNPKLLTGFVGPKTLMQHMIKWKKN
tara:strand:- start:152 stop:448 length:297 start_codon:yes stop_codon:yes gene_type:complete